MKAPDDLQNTCEFGHTYSEESARYKLQRHRERGEDGWVMFSCSPGVNHHWHVQRVESDASTKWAGYCDECGQPPDKPCLDLRYARRTGTFFRNAPHRGRAGRVDQQGE